MKAIKAIKKLFFVSMFVLFVDNIYANDDVSIMDLKETIYMLMDDVNNTENKMNRIVKNNLQPEIFALQKRVTKAEKDILQLKQMIKDDRNIEEVFLKKLNHDLTLNVRSEIIQKIR